jgi:hypothetical protein
VNDVLNSMRTDGDENSKPKFTPVSPDSLSSATPFFEKLASIAEEAVKSSIWCTCETSGSNATCAKEFVQCKLCRVSCCKGCVSEVSGYRLDYHDLIQIELTAEEHDLGSFQSKLREIVPSSLSFADDGLYEIAGTENDMHRVAALSGMTFNLHRIKRDRRKWLLLYYARANYGIGEALAELRITVGELKTQDLDSPGGVELGMMAELVSYESCVILTEFLWSARLRIFLHTDVLHASSHGAACLWPSRAVRQTTDSSKCSSI